MPPTKKVLITGANRGIGRGLAETFLSRPNHTVIGAVRDFKSPTAESLKAFKAAEGSSVILVKIEGVSETDADETVKVLAAEHGIHSLDIVIANAGIANVWTRVEGIDIKDMREFFEVNTYPVVRLLKAVYPLLKKTSDEGGQPIFVAVSTEAASIQDLEKNTPYLLGAYGASKVAVNYIVRRAHFENEWLTAFVVNPGFAQTDMGNFGAKKFGFEQAFVPVVDSVSGLIKHIDGASRETTSGKFLSYDGTEMLF
ncbi:hypothetical protein VSDG_10023 [Cytospora chrysosperma]|uniref:Uncharacterized protein n=1 Tax=Cytospora chrysosperma TaxID=252740 RepID=A0A423V8G5_CYTCH|nr:hypothetical protein VSDG_10023 [Valsa sordida]